ncbi:MAG TPA: [FeFe] hydrogenase H-cluster radical SAM maturase HydE [Armatimonadota bacterium]|nr:[FeFe] hydrogenase H-cluster radical SAM maturase HydE [Armatimonadota bacterium]
MLDRAITLPEIEFWLRTTSDAMLWELFEAADATRRAAAGHAVYLHGLVEISNYCVRQCHYCGLRAPNLNLPRYRMDGEQILAAARTARRLRYASVVLQAGEDYGIERDWLAHVVRLIRQRVRVGVTLSLGERPERDLVAWRRAGADTYVLKFETSDRELYDRIHPKLAGANTERMAMLSLLREIGFRVGSGVMVGIPGQTFASLARDIALFRDLQLDFIGVSPFIPAPGTPLAAGADEAPNGAQVPADELTTHKALALARLVRPEALIPASTALAAVNPRRGRFLALTRGANLMLPNLTPPDLRPLYAPYPGRPCTPETPNECRLRLSKQIRQMGRVVGRRAPDRRGHQSAASTAPTD